jgi:hypothetical protein
MYRRSRTIVVVAFSGIVAMGAELVLAEGGGPSAEEAEKRAYYILRAAMALRDVPLSVHPTCSRAAPQLPAKTIGDYLSGFLAAMEYGRNRITTLCRATAKVSNCELWLKHADDEDEWAWGIAFEINEKGQPDRSSVRCLGAG